MHIASLRLSKLQIDLVSLSKRPLKGGVHLFSSNKDHGGLSRLEELGLGPVDATYPRQMPKKERDKEDRFFMCIRG